MYLHRGLDAGGTWQGKHWSCDGFAFDRWTVNSIFSVLLLVVVFWLSLIDRLDFLLIVFLVASITLYIYGLTVLVVLATEYQQFWLAGCQWDWSIGYLGYLLIGCLKFLIDRFWRCVRLLWPLLIDFCYLLTYVGYLWDHPLCPCGLLVVLVEALKGAYRARFFNTQSGRLVHLSTTRELTMLMGCLPTVPIYLFYWHVLSGG